MKTRYAITKSRARLPVLSDRCCMPQTSVRSLAGMGSRALVGFVMLRRDHLCENAPLRMPKGNTS